MGLIERTCLNDYGRVRGIIPDINFRAQHADMYENVFMQAGTYTHTIDTHEKKIKQKLLDYFLMELKSNHPWKHVFFHSYDPFSAKLKDFGFIASCLYSVLTVNLAKSS